MPKIPSARLTLKSQRGQHQIEMTSIEMENDSSDTFLKSIVSKVPSVIIVSSQYLPQILKMTDFIKNFEVKDHSIALTQYLRRTKSDKIPLIMGNYLIVKKDTNTGTSGSKAQQFRMGKVIRSVIILLENWFAEPKIVLKYNVFIIGLEERLFDQIVHDLK